MYEIIKRLAEDRGMTIAQVARASGVSEAVLSMMKKRGSKLNIVNAVKVARVLNVDVNDLVNMEEEANDEE